MNDLAEMLKESKVYSLTRFMPTVSWLAWIVVTFYLVFTGKTWGNYGEFTAAAGTAPVVQLINKIVNSKWNTKQGEPGKNIHGGDNYAEVERENYDNVEKRKIGY